jgi:hypothetical protein
MGSAGFESDVEVVGVVFGAVVAPAAGLLHLSRAGDSPFHVLFGVQC